MTGDTSLSVHPDLSDKLTTDSKIVGNERFRGLSLKDAETAYTSIRVAEDGNDSFSSGSRHGRARATYGAMLDHCREARRSFDSPLVALQTFVFDPSEYARETGETACPVTARTAVVDGVRDALDTVRRRIDGDEWSYIGCTDLKSDTSPHFHLTWVASRGCLDSLDLRAGVERFVSSTTGAVADDHGDGALEIDWCPEESIETFGDDESHGRVHPGERYVASKLPHLSAVDEMNLWEKRQGAIAVASTGSGWIRSNPSTTRRDTPGRTPA